MKTILKQIKENQTFYSDFQHKERLQSNRNLLESFSNLINARCLLPNRYIDNLSGIYPQKIKNNGYAWNTSKDRKEGMSYLMIKNFLVHYARTGKLYKKSYNTCNTKEFVL
jgi:ankyrin repeat protein